MNESTQQKRPIYDDLWFQERAMSGIKRINENDWDYSDSLLLYLPGHEETYENVQDVSDPYHELVTAPERSYLESVAEKISEILPGNFDFIDLGPGTEHKEQYIFNKLKNQEKVFTYLPVDISERYLDISVKHAKQQGITTLPLKASFEEVSERLSDSGRDRFVSLGLTYSNYNPSEILNLLKEIRGENGNIFINSQIRERVDTTKLQSIYHQVGYKMIRPKLALLGLDLENDIIDIEATDEVKMWCTIGNINNDLEEKGLRQGDRILVFQSLRPTLEDLHEAVSAEFNNYELLDTGESFVGVVTK